MELGQPSIILARGAKMNIRFIDWDAIPKNQHLDILQYVHLGEYIDSLPPYLPITESANHIRLPISDEDLANLTSKPDYIEFEVHGLVKDMVFIKSWKRIR